MKRLGTKGAYASRKPTSLDADALPPLDSPQAACAWLEIIGRGVASGKVGPKEGTTLVKCIEAWLRAHDQGAVTKDIERLRSALEAWGRTGDAQKLLEIVR